MSIHPSAIVARSAELGSGVTIGPYAVIEDSVRVGDGCHIRSRAHLLPGTVLGKQCDIHMNAVVGHMPQDLSYKGEPIKTIVGDQCVIRENATIHGSVGEAGTQVGSGCLLMVGSHVAHNCKVGQNVILANGALLAGHVEVGDNAFISGNVVIHQFVRVGMLAILSGGSRFGMDIPPYMIGDGVNAITALNAVGLRRSKTLSDVERREIKAAFKLLYRSGLVWQEALAQVKAELKSPAAVKLIEFFTTPSRRGFCHFRAGRRKAQAETSD